MKANELETKTEFITTPFPQLNSVIGGIPLGKISEVAGSWSTGKSTLSYQIIAAAQAQGRPCLLADAERAFTSEYGKSLGVDDTSLDIIRARTAEEYLDAIIEWCEDKKHKGGLVCCDAIGALLPAEEAEKTSEAKTIGVQARLLGSFSRKIIPLLDDNKIAFLAVNHTFIPIGQMGIASSGGAKWAYCRSVWLVLSRAFGKPIKRSADGKKTLIPTVLEVKKDKVSGNEGTKIELELLPGSGFVGDFVAPLEVKKRGRPKKEV